MNEIETPLKLFQPMNLLVFLSFYSPIIITVFITSLSFIFQNLKGLIYLGFVVGCCLIRNYAYMLSGSLPIINDGTICSAIQYSKYGNPTFSAFVLSFTVAYLSIPMFVNNSVNYWTFIVLICYLFFDVSLKMYKQCIHKTSDVFLNVLSGGVSAAIIVLLMYAGGSSKYLFFNEMSTDKDVCSKPSNQTFKCKMYKDGTLIG